MNIEDDEKKKEKVKTRAAPVSFDQPCFNKNWILQLNEEKQVIHFVCLICKQVANHPLEINCPEHENMDEPLIVGKRCLQQFLDNNTTLVQSIHITVVNLEAPESGEEGVEGKTSTKPTCNFKGNIKELNDHLNNSCPLKLFACWFQSFGCDHSCLKELLEEHLISQKKNHFDLVIKHTKSLQQTTQHCQEESRKLQVENQTLESEMELLNKEIYSKNGEIQQLKDELKLKEKQLSQKGDELKAVQERSQQAIFRHDSVCALLKNDFSEKESQILKQMNELTKLLEEKDNEIDRLKKTNTHNEHKVCLSKYLSIFKECMNAIFSTFNNNFKFQLVFLILILVMTLRYFFKLTLLVLVIVISLFHKRIFAYCDYNLGNYYYDRKQYGKAIERYEKSLKLRLKILGTNHVDVAWSYNCLGNSYFNNKQFDESIGCHEKALQIRKELFGNADRVAGDSNWNLGLSFEGKKEKKTALKYYEEAYKIYAKVLGKSHEQTLKAKTKVKELGGWFATW
ncbi:hypothetical protein RFI_10739 [Reticulomyxa filosa]|uniref:Uncharacterized protein n=1 Tax=Reticulomyxa filosa TaxID=46433 RepID=X6NM11_RETFI|nr:hypothetical protein RFI_10739 [Reticulomyxa filosa]|eukprot:ETO26397.1 hypothetical protein RFI_10739 [Reticulomyxa filosa]